MCSLSSVAPHLRYSARNDETIQINRKYQIAAEGEHEMTQ